MDAGFQNVRVGALVEADVALAQGLFELRQLPLCGAEVFPYKSFFLCPRHILYLLKSSGQFDFALWELFLSIFFRELYLCPGHIIASDSPGR